LKKLTATESQPNRNRYKIFCYF